jgi:hypothetical protein
VETIKKVTVNLMSKSDRLFYNMIGRMTTDINSTMHSSQSRTYSSASVPNGTVTDTSETSICLICNSNQREVLYDCGHCIACKKCTKQIFFNINDEIELTREATNVTTESATYYDQYKKCPLCRKTVSTVRLLLFPENNVTIKCNETNCDNICKYMSLTCGHLTYCGKCIIKKQKCFCNADIDKHKLRKVFF